MTAQKKQNEPNINELAPILFGTFKGGIVVLDNDLTIKMTNKVMEEWFGHQKTLVGRKCHQVIHDDDQPCEHCPSLAVLRDGQTIAEEVPLQRDGKQIGWLEITSHPLKDDRGQVTGIVQFIRDITNRREAEKVLQAERSQLLSIFDSIDEPIYIADPHTYEIIYVNQQLKNLYSSELVGGLCYRELQGRDKPCEFCTNEIIMKNKGEPYQWEFYNPFLKKTVLITDRIIRWPDGRDVRFELAIDISKQKLVEETLLHQIQFEKMVADISSTFVSTPVENIDDAINHALRKTGEFFDADRSYVDRFTEDRKFFNNTHEWCAANVESVKERNQNFPFANLPWILSKVCNREYVYIPDIHNLPPEANIDKTDLLIEKVVSLLIIPMVRDGEVIGYFGFDTVNKKKTWNVQQIALLYVVAEIIASGIVKYEIEQALKESEVRYREILATIEEAYYEADLTGTIINCNQAVLNLLGGYTLEEIRQLNYKEIYKVPEEAFKTFNRVFVTGKPEKGLILEMIQKDGSIGFGELSISLIRDKEGYITGFKGIGRDVTERMEYEKRLEYLSLYDQLTGIYNRVYFETELERICNSSKYPITIISIDLDGLKLTNDTKGHSAGDLLLKNCAAILKKSLRKSDVLARVGGDEFSAILPRTDKATGEKVVRSIREALDFYNRQNEEHLLELSIGIATAEKSGIEPLDLFKRADDMMYRDKLYRSSSSRSRIVRSLLMTLAERDYGTEGHAKRLEQLCRAVGDKVNLTLDQQADLVLLTQVHDLGKVGIPDQILFKPGPLTEEEWDIMRTHPEKGLRIASSSPDLFGVAELILKHHERWDGSGYPLGLEKDEIPLECRIMAIVDAYDAMTTKRPYNTIKSAKEAVQELVDNAGTQFDPVLVSVFIAVLEEDTGTSASPD